MNKGSYDYKYVLPGFTLQSVRPCQETQQMGITDISQIHLWFSTFNIEFFFYIDTNMLLQNTTR